jgi:hypothetical protein
MGDTDTADFSSLVKLMTIGERYTFEDIVTQADEAGIFERLLSDKDKDEQLSRKAKSSFGKLLCKYAGRRVDASGTTFVVEGKGRGRRFTLLARHGTHGRHGVSPSLETATFYKELTDHDDHDYHTNSLGEATGFEEPHDQPPCEPRAPSAGSEAVSTSRQASDAEASETCNLRQQWAEVLANVIKTHPLIGQWLSNWEKVTLDGEILRVSFPSSYAGLLRTPVALKPAALIKSLWAGLHGRNVEFRPQANGEPPPHNPHATCNAPVASDFENDPGIDAAIEQFGASLIDEGKNQH